MDIISLSALAKRLRVRALLFADANHDVHEPSVVLQALFRAADKVFGGPLSLLHLGCLPTDLTRTRQRTVDLAHAGNVPKRRPSTANCLKPILLAERLCRNGSELCRNGSEKWCLLSKQQ